jgi:hypothetical protein
LKIPVVAFLIAEIETIIFGNPETSFKESKIEKELKKLMPAQCVKLANLKISFSYGNECKTLQNWFT